jgi:hypothetical protein
MAHPPAPARSSPRPSSTKIASTSPSAKTPSRAKAPAPRSASTPPKPATAHDGKLWSYTKIGRSISTVAIANDLLFAADFDGKLYCLNPDTGEVFWTHDTEARIWGSPLVADGKVYLGNEQGDLTILAASKEKKGDQQDQLRRRHLLHPHRRQRHPLHRHRQMALRDRRELQMNPLRRLS